MKKLIVVVSCVLVLVVGMVQVKDWKEICIVFDVFYELFEYKDENGELIGFEVELVEVMCVEMEVNCEFVIQVWDGMILGLLVCKFDVIMLFMLIILEWVECVLFFELYYNILGGWFVFESFNIDVIDMEVMKGKVVGVQCGIIMDIFVINEMGGMVIIKCYIIVDDMVLDFEGQCLDVVFVDYLVGEQIVLSKDGFKEVGELVKLGEGVGVVMCKCDIDLVEQVNVILEKLKNDGIYDVIMQKYFLYDIKM